MRNKPLLMLMIALPLVGVFVLALQATSTFTYRHWQGVNLEVSADRGLRLPGTGEKPRTAATTSAGTPKAVVPAPEHDFGLMNPMATAEHFFTIHNDGDAPLTLEKGDTTCKCTFSNVRDGRIPPGGKGQVRLEWNAGREPLYKQEAVIKTNDPINQRVTLTVKGIVRRAFSAAPSAADFDGIKPGDTKTVDFLLFSEVWTDTEVLGAEFSMPGLEWTTEVIPKSQLASSTKSAHRVTLTAPGDLPSGKISDRIQFRWRAKDGEAGAQTLVVPIKGEVLGRLSVYGGVDGDGEIQFGHVDYGKGAKKKLLLTVRDDEHDLAIENAKVYPDFLKVRLRPYKGKTRDVGLVYLEVEVPKDAPECSYRGASLGRIQIDFDHPRIKDLHLKANFAVVR